MAGLWDFIKGNPVPGKDVGRFETYDWCRFRRDNHCYFPHFLDEDRTAEAGYSVWIPEDRGICPRASWEDQKVCPAPSAPGPNVPGGLSDATISWEDGGQRTGEPEPAPEATGAPPAGDITEQLEHLSKLHREGDLTDEEFRLSKEALLSGKT